jgi:geranylgeranyl diphosphate synthase, type I
MTTLDMPSTIDQARELVAPALAEAVARLDPALWRFAAYHFGWCDEAGAPIDLGAGKGIRSALALLAAQACGSERTVAVPGAVAVELVHNFSLIHDDIIDGDEKRRHRSTVWKVFGADKAIITGDALFALAVEELLAARGGAAAAAALLSATSQMILGQAEDMSNPALDDVTVSAVMATGRKKTGAILGSAASVGALLAFAPSGSQQALQRFGEHLGVAFQAIDDVLGIWGDPAVTGKPVGNDLREGRRTLPIALALATGGAGARRLRSLLDRPSLADDDVEAVTSLLVELGARARTEHTARQHLDLATAALGHADLDRGSVDDLNDLAAFVCSRQA